MTDNEIFERYNGLVLDQVEIYKRTNALLEELDNFMADNHGKYSLSNLTKIYDELKKNFEHQQTIRRMMHRARDTELKDRL